MMMMMMMMVIMMVTGCRLDVVPAFAFRVVVVKEEEEEEVERGGGGKTPFLLTYPLDTDKCMGRLYVFLDSATSLRGCVVVCCVGMYKINMFFFYNHFFTFLLFLPFPLFLLSYLSSSCPTPPTLSLPPALLPLFLLLPSLCPPPLPFSFFLLSSSYYFRVFLFSTE